MKILLLEDDHLQAEEIMFDLKNAFPNTKVEIVRKNTESDFRGHIDKIENDLPDLAILDIMVRWADPAPRIPQMPDDVRQEGDKKAGLRCRKLLLEKVPNIPVILYSILEADDLEVSDDELNGVKLLEKHADLNSLVAAIKQLKII